MWHLYFCSFWLGMLWLFKLFHFPHEFGDCYFYSFEEYHWNLMGIYWIYILFLAIHHFNTINSAELTNMKILSTFSCILKFLSSLLEVFILSVFNFFDFYDILYWLVYMLNSLTFPIVNPTWSWVCISSFLLCSEPVWVPGHC